MARWSTGELTGRIAAFLFAGVAAGFGAAILVDWVMSLLGMPANLYAIAAGVAVVLALLAYRLFAYTPPLPSDSNPGRPASDTEEQS